jgi:hypothetical protein
MERFLLTDLAPVGIDLGAGAGVARLAREFDADAVALGPHVVLSDSPFASAGLEKRGKLQRQELGQVARPLSASRRVLQREWWTHIPVIGGAIKMVWCNSKMKHIAELRRQCMTEFNEKCPGDLTDPECLMFFKNAGEYSGNISDAIMACMKDKDPDAIKSFLEVCTAARYALLTD